MTYSKMKRFQSSNSRALPAIVSLGIAIAFGLTSGSVLAGKTHEEATGKPYENTKAPHEAPYKAEPPTGGHKNLAAAATNPLANLMQFQFQYQYNFRHHNTDDTSWSGIFAGNQQITVGGLDKAALMEVVREPVVLTLNISLCNKRLSGPEGILSPAP